MAIQERRNPLRSLLAALAVVAASAVVAGACHAAPTKIRLGVGGASAENLSLLLARPDLTPNQNKVYSLEYTRFEGTDKRFQAFEAGAIDLAIMNGQGALFAAAEGIPFKIIASVTKESSKGAVTNYMVKDGSPIKTIKDLKGKTIGVVSLSSDSELQVNVVLAKVGLKPSDVKITPIPYPASYDALKSGLVDVGSFPQPFLAMAKHRGGMHTLFTSKDAAPYDEELIVLIGNSDFLAAHRTAVEAFLADLRTATEFYAQHTKEARQALIKAKAVNIDPAVFMEMQDPYHEPDLRLDLAGLAKMQDMQVNAGFQSQRADLSQYVDESYLPKN